jgi:hypothetical protein
MLLHLQRFSLDEFYQPIKLSEPIELPYKELEFSSYRLPPSLIHLVENSSQGLLKN